MVAHFFDSPKVRDLTGAAHRGHNKASGSLPTTEPHVFHTLRRCRGRLCPAGALTEVVFLRNPLEGGTAKKWMVAHFFDAPKVRDLTGAAHRGLGKASGSLRTTEPHVLHTLRPCGVFFVRRMPLLN